MRFFIAFLAGLAGDLLFYKITHLDGFPELGRYGIGGVLIVSCSWIIAQTMERGRVITRDDVALIVSAACVSSGSGVFLGRMIQMALGW